MDLGYRSSLHRKKWMMTHMSKEERTEYKKLRRKRNRNFQEHIRYMQLVNAIKSAIGGGKK